MKNIFFDQGSRPLTSSQSTSKTSQRDSSQVSSRWKEVSEKKSPKERPVERKLPGSQQPKKRGHLPKGKQPVEFNDEQENTSPFDIFGNLESSSKQQDSQYVSLPEL